MNTSVTYRCLQLHLCTYKYNCMFCDSLTQFKSQDLDLGVLKFIFYFIFQNSSVSVISWFWLQGKLHRTLKINKCVVHTEWHRPDPLSVGRGISAPSHSYKTWIHNVKLSVVVPRNLSQENSDIC